MTMKRQRGNREFDESVLRPFEPVQLFENEVVNDTVARNSGDVECAQFRQFGLFVYIDFTGTADTINLQIEVEFLDRWTGRWYHYKQGLFAALFWEETDTADGIYEVFAGDCLGRAIRVKLTGIGVSGSNYFTVSIGLDLWN